MSTVVLISTLAKEDPVMLAKADLRLKPMLCACTGSLNTAELRPPRDMGMKATAGEMAEGEGELDTGAP